jgi:NADPH:quinone reductase-like Zn-dependent oxidoreductase
MRAVVHTSHGGPSVLRAVSLPDPVPGPSEVLVAVRAAALNRLDLLQRRGPGLLPGFALPHVPGMDVAGEIVSPGPRHGERVVVNPALPCGRCELCLAGDDTFCGSMRIVGGNRQGGYAELLAVPAQHAHPIPDGVSYEEAAGLPTVYGTAWQALVVRGGLRSGETVLIHGAGSGLSIAAAQIAARLGATVIVTSGSPEKLSRMAGIGVPHLIDHRTQDLGSAVRDLTGGRGADLVFDHVGPALFDRSLAALRLRGRMVFCGNTTGTHVSLDLADAFRRGITLIGAESYGTAEFGRMLSWYWTAGCKPVADSVHGLDDAAQAHIRMESGDAFGKILLVP